MAVTDVTQLRATLVANLAAGMLCQTTLLNMFDTLAADQVTQETPHPITLSHNELLFPAVYNIGEGATLYSSVNDGSAGAFITHLFAYLQTFHVNLSRIEVNQMAGVVLAYGGHNHTLPDEILSEAPTGGVSWNDGVDSLTMTQANALATAYTTSDTDIKGSLSIRIGNVVANEEEGVHYWLFSTGAWPLGTDLGTLGDAEADNAGAWEDIKDFITDGGLLGGSIVIDFDGLSDHVEYLQQKAHVEAVDNYDYNGDSEGDVFDDTLQASIDAAIAAGGPFDATLQTSINTALTAATLSTLPTFATGQAAAVMYNVTDEMGVASAVATLDIAST